MKNETCETRIDKALQDRLADLTWLLAGVKCEELGRLEDYALGFDYVPPYTFDDQSEGYFRYQISWGGPSDEFRFFYRGTLDYRFEYWFLDWFDGAHRDCSRDRVVLRLWCWLLSSGAVAAARRKAQQ